MEQDTGGGTGTGTGGTGTGDWGFSVGLVSGTKPVTIAIPSYDAFRAGTAALNIASADGSPVTISFAKLAAALTAAGITLPTEVSKELQNLNFNVLAWFRPADKTATPPETQSSYSVSATITPTPGQDLLSPLLPVDIAPILVALIDVTEIGITASRGTKTPAT